MSAAKAGALVLVVLVAAGVVWMTNGASSGRDGSTRLTVPESVPKASVDEDLTPTDFVAEDFGDSVQLAWNDATDGVQPHILLIEGDDGSIIQPPELELGQTSVTVRGLDPGVGYCFRLLAITQDLGRSEPALAEVRGGCLGEI